MRPKFLRPSDLIPTRYQEIYNSAKNRVKWNRSVFIRLFVIKEKTAHKKTNGW